MMAYANDISYDGVFVEPLKNFMKKEDCVIGISGSENPRNIIQTLKYANAIKGITIGLTGYSVVNN